MRTERLLDEDAVADWVTDGMTIAIGDPAPMSIVRAVIRRRAKELTVVGSGLSLDLLIAAGCVSRTISYYAGIAGVPVAPAFRRAVEAGEVDVWECEEGILTTGLRAAAQGLPFLPWRGGLGTSLPELNPDLKIMTDPIQGETLLAVPAIQVDVAFLHAGQADAYGNVQHVGGPGWLDLFLARAARRIAVSVEKIIPNEHVRAQPAATTIADVDAVVRAPFGAHPFYSRGYYIQDKTGVHDYVTAARAGGDDLDGYLRETCVEPADHLAYLELVGIRRLLGLQEYGDP